MKLGFSTSTLYKSQTPKEALCTIGKTGCSFVELSALRADELNFGRLDEITKKDLEDFEYVSFHAPKFDYGVNRESTDILNRIKNFNDTVRKLDLVIFHPDTIKDFSVLDNCGLNIGIENMDSRKNSYKNTEELKKILDEYPHFSLVLDVNHICTNDSSMELANKFYDELGPKVSEIHLSGFVHIHEPLFETHQMEILKIVQNYDVPIIIESILTPENIQKEKEYITQKLVSV